MKLRLILSLALTSALPLCQAATLDETAMNIALRNPAVMSARAGYEADLASARAENILAGPILPWDGSRIWTFGHRRPWAGSRG